MRTRTLAILAIVIIGAAFGLSSCGNSSKGSSSSGAADNTFVLGEFTIIPPKNTMHAGAVTITADNRGGETHELVIVRAARADSLPTKSDGSVNEDKIPAAQKIGEIEDIAAGTQRSKRFDLANGTYVAFCNIVDSMMGSSSPMMHDSDSGSGMGHVHFAEGMHTTFTVN